MGFSLVLVYRRRFECVGAPFFSRLPNVRGGHSETGLVPLGLLSPIFPPNAADYDA